LANEHAEDEWRVLLREKNRHHNVSSLSFPSLIVISTERRNLEPSGHCYYVDLFEHKTKMVTGFTEKYNGNNLVVAVNPKWNDLSDGWFEISPFGRDDNSARREKWC
jgi:hypothetical protein